VSGPLSIFKANGTPEIKAAIREKELELEALYNHEAKKRELDNRKCNQCLFIGWKYVAAVTVPVAIIDTVRAGVPTEIGMICGAALAVYSLYYAMMYLEINF
jgi:hypothetical protein